MAVVQNLYQILKLPASLIVRNNCCCESSELYRKTRDDAVITIGDDEYKIKSSGSNITIDDTPGSEYVSDGTHTLRQEFDLSELVCETE